MNERIKELLEQASEVVEYKEFGACRTQVNQEKFAELLINECMYVGRMSQINNGLVDSDIHAHFGVNDEQTN